MVHEFQARIKIHKKQNGKRFEGKDSVNNKITLSNTTDAELQAVQIAAAADENVLVTWWHVNSTGEEPVARISTDNGQTFEPLLNLAANGAITLIG